MKRILTTAVIFLFLILINSTANVYAALGKDATCTRPAAGAADPCDKDLSCQVTKPADPTAVPPVLEEAKCLPVNSITIDRPNQGFFSLGNAVSNLLTLAFAVAALIVLVMLILGAFEWITSGGDKEAVGKARSRIVNALIGLVVLAVAFALSRVAAQFTGLDLTNILIPTPNPSATGL